MSYDRETRKKRLVVKKKIRRDHLAKKDRNETLRTFKEVKHEMELRNNRNMRDSEILAQYLMELEDEDDSI